MRRTIILFILMFITNNFAYSQGYWHQILEDEKRYSVAYNIVGDSSVLYTAGITKSLDNVGIYKSTNLGKTWNIIYKEEGPKFPPYAYFRGLEYPAPGYMYLVFSKNLMDYEYTPDSIRAGTSIKRLDERTGQIVDSIVIETKNGTTNLDIGATFEMYDSLNGIICNGGELSITHDGWKSFKKFEFNIDNYDTNRAEDKNYFQHVMYWIHMISRDSLFFRGHTWSEYLQSKDGWYDFCLMILNEGDTTFTYENLTKGIRLKITNDSIHTLSNKSEIYYKRPVDFAYINDSTWVYTAPGKRTGYGKCETLEIFKTKNRGKYFEQVCLMDLQAFGLNRIKFKDAQNGLAVGNSASLRTTDGGETWFADTAFYYKDWTKTRSGDGIWNVHINYADGMEFLGCFSVGVFKYETEFGAGAIDEKQKSHLVYPNPAHSGDMVTIDYPEYINGEILIHDIYGKHIDKVNFIGNSFRLKEGIPKGTYFIVISSNGEVLGREKFIVTE